jgi:hypothetical protein
MLDVERSPSAKPSLTLLLHKGIDSSEGYIEFARKQIQNPNLAWETIFLDMLNSKLPHHRTTLDRSDAEC